MGRADAPGLGGLHDDRAWFETLPLVALTMTKILDCNDNSHDEELALRAHPEPRAMAQRLGRVRVAT